jgi:putative membrane protein
VKPGAASAYAGSFWGRRPFAWVGFVLVLFAIPFAGYALDSGRSFIEILPTANACLNATSALLLVGGYLAIRKKNVALHWRFMLAATLSSGVFLIFYLIRFAMTGVHRYPVDDWTRTVYVTVLGTHTVLAATVPFLAGLTLFRAWKKRFIHHRRIARWALPIWLYVSVTGVVVYLMLYQLAPLRLR